MDCFASAVALRAMADKALAMTECVVGSPAYSSFGRVIAIDASVLVRVHSMLRRL